MVDIGGTLLTCNYKEGIMKKIIMALAMLVVCVNGFAYSTRIQQSLDAANETTNTNRQSNGTIHYNSITGNYEVSSN